MPADVTPTPASQSYLAQVAYDTIEARVGPFPATATSVSTGPVLATQYTPAIVTAAAATSQFTATTLYKTMYSTGGATSVTTYIGATSTPVTVTTQKFSAPITSVGVTQYFTIVPTNTTVWNSQNSPSSLMAAGLADIVSYTASVVSNSTY